METPLTHLENLVKIPSVSGDEHNVALYCESFLKANNFDVSRQHIDTDEVEPSSPPRFNLLAQKGESHLPTLLLYAHLDTVPPDRAYTQDPFAVHYDLDHPKGPRAYGLGVSDMKSGVAVILSAVQGVQPDNYCLKVAFGVDEEAFSAGAWQLSASGWCQNVELALVPELVIDSDTEQLGIGRAGLVSFTLRCQGPIQHGAVPLTEPSSIDNALSAIAHLKRFPLLANSQLPERLIIHGIHASIAGLTYPPVCDVKASFFLSPERSAHALHADLNLYFENTLGSLVHIHLAPRPTPVAGAYAVDERHAAVEWLQRLYKKNTNRTLPLAHGWSVADENVLQETVKGPVLSFAPVGGFSHRAGEWLCLQSFERMVSLYQNILREAGTYFA